MNSEKIPLIALIYFIKDVETITRRNRLTLRRWWLKNTFPRPTLINGRLAWRSEAIQTWIKDNVRKEIQHNENDSPTNLRGTKP